MSNRYVVLKEDRGSYTQECIFSAVDDDDAETYVEENFDADSGKLILYRLKPVMEWPQ